MVFSLAHFFHSLRYFDFFCFLSVFMFLQSHKGALMPTFSASPFVLNNCQRFIHLGENGKNDRNKKVSGRFAVVGTLLWEREGIMCAVHLGGGLKQKDPFEGKHERKQKRWR